MYGYKIMGNTKDSSGDTVVQYLDCGGGYMNLQR